MGVVTDGVGLWVMGCGIWVASGGGWVLGIVRCGEGSGCWGMGGGPWVMGEEVVVSRVGERGWRAGGVGLCVRRSGRWECGGGAGGTVLFTVWPSTLEEEPVPCQRLGQIVTEVPVPCRRFETNVTEEHVLDKGSKNCQKGGKNVKKR